MDVNTGRLFVSFWARHFFGIVSGLYYIPEIEKIKSDRVSLTGDLDDAIALPFRCLWRAIMHLSKKSDEFGFYTRESDGASGMTVTTLADFCGTSQPVMTNLLNRVRDSDPISNELSDSLKPFAGKELRSSPIDNYGTRIVTLDACKAVIEHFACNTRKYKGRNTARPARQK